MTGVLWALATLLLALPATIYVLRKIDAPTPRHAIVAFVVDATLIGLLIWLRLRLVGTSLVLGMMLAGLLVFGVYGLGRLALARRRASGIR